MEHQGYFDPFRYHKGAFIGKVEAIIKRQAKTIGLPINERGRKIRLALAEELLDREVESFNDLTDQEIWDVRYWCARYGKRLREWLGETYGYQEKMF